MFTRNKKGTGARLERFPNDTNVQDWVAVDEGSLTVVIEPVPKVHAPFPYQGPAFMQGPPMPPNTSWFPDQMQQQRFIERAFESCAFKTTLAAVAGNHADCVMGTCSCCASVRTHACRSAPAAVRVGSHTRCACVCVRRDGSWRGLWHLYGRNGSHVAWNERRLQQTDHSRGVPGHGES